MEPGDEAPQTSGGAPSPSPSAIAMVAVVVALVVLIVGFGGGVTRPLTTAAPHAAATPAAQAQG